LRAAAPRDAERGTTKLPDTVAEPNVDLAYDRACDRIELQRAAQDINVSIDDLELLATTRVAGLRITDIATGSNADRLRQRRHRAERRLRNHLVHSNVFPRPGCQQAREPATVRNTGRGQHLRTSTYVDGGFSETFTETLLCDIVDHSGC
jgi:hypothetical protein